MIYDGDCGFCGLWIRRWKQMTGDRVEYIASQDPQASQRFPEIPRAELDTAVHLIETDGRVYRGAEAVIRALAIAPFRAWLLRIYEGSPLVASGSELGYRFVARHRLLFSCLTRMLWGGHVEQAGYDAARRLFLGLVGAIYLVAFGSLWVQVSGLIGTHGIVPASELMSHAQHAVASQGLGLSRFQLMPTLCWFGASDALLKLQCGAGCGLALLLMAGVAPPLCLAMMWVFYLSLTTVGSDFLAFQWDNLLLETGFLAIFLAPFQWLPKRSSARPPSRLALWLLRVLLFKLMFLSGVVKLTSGDPTWRNLTALTYHYQTQPLPTWIAWYAHQLPLWFQKTSCGLMFAIELVAPWFIFLPRRPRMAAGVALSALQLFILVTGNYTFFNWLTLALCVLLFDDFVLGRLWPRPLAPGSPSGPQVSPLPHRFAAGCVAIVFVGLSLMQMVAAFGPLPGWTSPVVTVYRWLAPFRTVNSYGLFAVMTTERPEIVIEGSADGREWKEYEFRYKPGDLLGRPQFVAPYQPRLDWQMWFAALGTYQQNPWFINFSARLLEGSPTVLALMKKNPFPGGPPKYLRAQLYDYRFTTFAERARTGAWWKRTYKGSYLPVISLDMLQPSNP